MLEAKKGGYQIGRGRAATLISLALSHEDIFYLCELSIHH